MEALDEGAISLDEVVACADRLLVEEADVALWLIDVSLSKDVDSVRQALRQGAESVTAAVGPEVTVYLMLEALRIGRRSAQRTIENMFHVALYENCPASLRDEIYLLDHRLNMLLNGPNDGEELRPDLLALRSKLLAEVREVARVQDFVDRCRG